MPQMRRVTLLLIALTVGATGVSGETIGPFGRDAPNATGPDPQATMLEGLTAPEATGESPFEAAERPFDIFTTLGAMLPPSEWAHRDAATQGTPPLVRDD